MLVSTQVWTTSTVVEVVDKRRKYKQGSKPKLLRLTLGGICICRRAPRWHGCLPTGLHDGGQYAPGPLQIPHSGASGGQFLGVTAEHLMQRTGMVDRMRSQTSRDGSKELKIRSSWTANSQAEPVIVRRSQKDEDHEVCSCRWPFRCQVSKGKPYSGPVGSQAAVATVTLHAGSCRCEPVRLPLLSQACAISTRRNLCALSVRCRQGQVWPWQCYAHQLAFWAPSCPPFVRGEVKRVQ